MQQKAANQNLVGIGLYGPSEAACLTGASTSQVRKWLLGQEAKGTNYKPLWSREIVSDEFGLTLGFRDLIQLRVAYAFIREGMSAQKVRKAILLAQEIKGHSHPLASADFSTDGKSVFLKVLEKGSDDRLIDLFTHGQYVLRKIIAPSLRGVDFVQDEAVRWRPFSELPRIVLDPARQFGAPIDSESGVPSRILANAAKAEGSSRAVAQLYRVSEISVRQSIEFEHKLAA